MKPPEKVIAFLRWFCREDCIEEVEGDLTEVFNKEYRQSPRRARWKFAFRVIRYFRPAFMKSLKNFQPDSFGMYKSYFKIGWRSLLRNKGYSVINIAGLAMGMMVAMFVGLWVYDELSFNKYHKNYSSIAQAWSGYVDLSTGEIGGTTSMQYPVGPTLRNNYSQYFRHVLMCSWVGSNTLSSEDKKVSRTGWFAEPAVLDMLSLQMIKGSYKSLEDPRSIVLSKSTAEMFFGDEDPMNKTLRIDNRMDVQVTGIYEDIPKNNQFADVQFLSTWALWLSYNEWAQRQEADWDNHPFPLYVQLNEGVSFEEANAAINDLYVKNMPADFYKTQEKFKPFLKLVPMSTWHLYSDIRNGVPSGGRITYVWLFAIVGIFVLMLACINFVNLSTARSEKRAREVGVRKVVGSRKGQLVTQFLTESFVVVVIAFMLALVLVTLLQDPFNTLTNKDISLPLSNIYFWGIVLGFILVTSFLAGLYPAFYLSSFQPVKVLKGLAATSRYAALPRKMLVVMQFTASVLLIIGTLVVYRQIEHARERPVGYNRESLVTVRLNDPDYGGKVSVLQTQLEASGVVQSSTISSGPLTAIWNSTGGYEWPGKDPNVEAEFAICNVALDFGKTVGWQIVSGRDFSTQIGSDSTESIIINEAAARYMGMDDPVGKVFTDVDEEGNKKWSRIIVGVVKDLVMENPYAPVRQTLYFYNPKVHMGQMTVRIAPAVSASVALPKIKDVFSAVAPSALFEYAFVDEEYARKFSDEERIGKLTGMFAGLAIVISCIGLLGLASYMAQQRTKEIGVRKILGASVPALWQLLSRDFIILVGIACCIAIPVGYHLMNQWLSTYEYHTNISWWMLILTAVGAVAITLITVSFQAIRAAKANPVKSLRSE
jgi:putative ABC transport system permease protein